MPILMQIICLFIKKHAIICICIFDWVKENRPDGQFGKIFKIKYIWLKVHCEIHNGYVENTKNSCICSIFYSSRTRIDRDIANLIII